MSKWLKIDASSGAPSLTVGIAGALGNGFTVSLDVFVPATTVTSIGVGNYTADWFQAYTAAINLGGVFAQIDSGPVLTQWNDVTPNPAFGTIPQDTIFHIDYVVAFDSGTSWQVTVKIDGVAVDTFLQDFGIDTTEAWDRLTVGGLLPAHAAGEIYYISNVTLVDSSSTVLFTDDFTDVTLPGTLGPWDSSVSVSNLSIVDTPGTGGGGPVATPGGDDCASAAALTGVSGTILDDNSTWAGTWPAGADPLFNTSGTSTRGGGAPKWWKWTNTTGRRVDFQVKQTDGIATNGGIAIGVCGSLNMEDDNLIPGADYNGEQSDWHLTIGSEILDLIVNPGETVYIEIDSYYSSAGTEPPDPTGHTGSFTFEWGAHTVTFYDTMQSHAGFGAHSNTGLGGTYRYPESEILATDVFDLTDASDGPAIGTILDGLSLNGRYYFVSSINTDGSFGVRQVLWVGSCLADGTDLRTSKVSSYDDGRWEKRNHDNAVLITDFERFAQLCTDGTTVWLAYAWQDTRLSPEDTAFTYTKWCPGYGLTEFDIYRDQDTVEQWTIELVDVTDASAPTSFWTLVSNATPPAGHNSYQYGPLWGGPGHGLQAVGIYRMQFRACASSNDPGAVWVAASYGGYTVSIADRSNEWPSCGLGDFGPDKLYAVETSTDVHAYFDVWRVVSGDIQNMRHEETTRNVEYLAAYDRTVNPLFGNPATYADGEWRTFTPSPIPFDTVGTQSLWIFNDREGGVPIIARQSLDKWGQGDSGDVDGQGVYTYFDTLRFEDAVTGTEIQTLDWSQATPESPYSGSGPNTILDLYISSVFFDPLTNLNKRWLSMYWSSGSPAARIAKITSTVDELPTAVLDGSLGSIEEGQSIGIYPDSIRNVWAVNFSSADNFDHLCNDFWFTAAGFRGTTNYYRFYRQAGYWSPEEVPFIVLFCDDNKVRRFNVIRDFWICVIGDIITGCPPSVLWFRVNDVWHQQNVDPEYSLWTFHDGAWVQNCTDLHAQLQGSWQN